MAVLFQGCILNFYPCVVFVAIVLACICEGAGLVCYCEGHCPSVDGQYKFNGTCEVSENSYCFTVIEIHTDDSGIETEEKSYGCLAPDETGLMQCHGYLRKSTQRKNITCCREYDYCNLDLNPQIYWEEKGHVYMFPDPILLVILALLSIIILVFCLFFWIKWQQMNHQQLEYCKNGSLQPCTPFIPRRTTLKEMIEQSSGSGSGLPCLVQRTIAKQIQLVHCVGKGSYSEVWLGHWRGEKVAVKIFFTIDEASWIRETQIYETVLLRHDNILGFIAADIKGNGSWTQMLLITDFYEHGSLHDFLQINTLTQGSMYRMTLSVVSGLAHLHAEIFGTKGKPSIAHRDIKSKNILVKRSGECCIADFGLAIKYSSENNELDLGANPKVGTRRYMPPEVLNETMKKTCFESLKMADMYSLALVFWEIGRRCVSFSGEKMLTADEYRLPYYDCVPRDPSFEDMLEAVCLKGIRPEIPARWHSDESLKALEKVMRECWQANPTARLTALRVKKTILKMPLPESAKVV